MKEQKTDVHGFAAFTEQQKKIKEHVPNLKMKVEYIKNLFEVQMLKFKSKISYEIIFIVVEYPI